MSKTMFCAGIAFALMASSGCSGEGSVGANAFSVDRSTQALTSGALKFANGTYGAGCTERSGSWSLAINGFSGALDHPPLSVVKNNTGCVLTLSGLVADRTYGAFPEMALGDSYQSSASAFFSEGSSLAFFANARLSSVSFAGDFTATILYSDDPGLIESSNTATYAVSSASASSAQVAAPDYTLDMTGVAVQTDQNRIEQSASGSAALTDGSVTGQAYVVVSSLASSSFADVDSAFRDATPTAISDANPTIAAAAFSLGSIDLSSPALRYLIIANTVSGVTSYQLFTITFNAPN